VVVASWPWSWWLKKEGAGSNICFQPYPTSRGRKGTEQKHNKYHQGPFIQRGLHLLHLWGLFLILFSARRKTTPSSSWFQLKHHNPLLPLDSLNRFTSSQSLHYHFHLEPIQNQHNIFIPSSFTLNSFNHHLHYHLPFLITATITRVQHTIVK